MTKLAVVAYPSLTGIDQEWIEGIRASHDPQAERIRAHFTLVFPLEIALEPLADLVRAAAVQLDPFPVVLRRAKAVRDVVAEGSHVFLLPEEGRARLIDLHERLYTGALAPHLRADIPFEPHVTVAACRTLEECARIAADIDREHRELRGTLHGVEILDVSAPAIQSVMHMPFAGIANRDA